MEQDYGTKQTDDEIDNNSKDLEHAEDDDIGE